MSYRQTDDAKTSKSLLDQIESGLRFTMERVGAAGSQIRADASEQLNALKALRKRAAVLETVAERAHGRCCGKRGCSKCGRLQEALRMLDGAP